MSAAAARKHRPAVRVMTGDEMISFVDRVSKGGSAEGEAIVGLSGTYYVKPEIDAEKLGETLENNYVTEQLDRLVRLIFTDPYKIHVYTPNGDEDEDVAWDMEKAWEIKDVSLWSTCLKIWKDYYGWGCALISPGWKRNGANMDIMELRRLPPESFALPPAVNGKYTYSEILQGITLGDDGLPRYWQTLEGGHPTELKNVLLMKDPVESGLAGKSKLLPMIPVVNLINFSWQAQAQKVNRVGAPPLFIHFTKPPVVDKNVKRDDLLYVQRILKNWGRNTQWALYDNMELVTLQLTDNQSAIQTIEKLEQRIRDYFSPATIIKREGPTIGGSTTPEGNLTLEYIKGHHRVMEMLVNPLLQQWLDWNGYEGWTAEIEFPVPTPDSTTIDIQKAIAGGQLKVLTIDEMRVLLGHPELTDEQRAILEAEIKARAPPPSPFGGSPFGAPGPGQDQQQGPPEDQGPGTGSQDDVPAQDQDQGPGETPAPPQQFTAKQFFGFPYTNEHAARMVDPDTLRDGKEDYGSKDIGPGIRIIEGRKKSNGDWVTQAYRFDARKFTADQARAWLKRHGKKPILFEPAKGEQQTHTEHQADADELALREEMVRADQEALARIARTLQNEQGGRS